MRKSLQIRGLSIAAGVLIAGTSATARTAGAQERPRDAGYPPQSAAAAVTAIVNLTELADQSALNPQAGSVEPRSIHRPLGRPEVAPDISPVPWFPTLPDGPRTPSPAYSQTFDALDDGGFVIPPDTHGAVGRARVMTTLNDNYRVQDRAGAVVATVAMSAFWAPVASGQVFDPRVTYDPYNDRWIVAATASAFSASSAVLLGVSLTDDPAGDYYLISVDADEGNLSWADFPMLGFNRNWVVVSVNMFLNDGRFLRTKLFTWSYPGLRARISKLKVFALDTEFSVQPAVTSSPTEETLHLVSSFSVAAATYGHARMTGTPSDPSLSSMSSHSTLLGLPACVAPRGDILPQAGSGSRIDVGDARIGNVVFRNGKIWYVQTVGLPASGVQRTAIQWVQLDASGVFVQGGRIEDSSATPTSGYWYAYPSIAVNRFDEVLIGFSRFSAGTFASAGYAHRQATDAPGTMSDPVVFKPGQAAYVKTFGGSSNRWGDYSATVVDPVNDADLWTLQAYARPPKGSGAISSQWGTAWARVATQNASGAAPTITDVADRVVDEDTSTGAIAFTVGDADTAAGSLIVTASSSSFALLPTANIATGGSGTARTVTVTPAADQSGTATVTLTVSDGTLTATDAFVLTVNPINDPPVLDAIPDRSLAKGAAAQTVSLTGIGSGAANEAQTLTVTALSSNTALVPPPTVAYTSPAATGSLTFVPVAGATGAATITVSVGDGGATNGSVARTFTVTVGDVAGAPTISDIKDVTVAVGMATGAIPFTVGDPDTPLASLSVSCASSNPALVAVASIVLGGSGGSRTLTITPAAGRTGSSTITVTVSDGTFTASDSFVLTVGGAVNAPPTLDAIANRAISEDAGVQTVALSGIGSGSASETQTLTITASSSNTTVVPNPGVTYTSPNTTGSLSFTPAANQHGTATISVTVNDGGPDNNTLTRTFVVSVASVNDAPTLTDITDRTISRNTSTGPIPVTVGDVDSNLDSLTLSAASSNAALVPVANIVFSGTGAARSLTVTPAANQSGTATLTISVSDGSATASDAFVLTVATVAPTVAITTPATSPATSTSPFLTVAGTAVSDVGVAAVTWTTSRGRSGTALLSARSGGTADARTWTAEVPVPSGTTTFTMTVTDALGATASATASATVSSYVYYLAEGATGPFFDLELLVANPNTVSAPVQISYLKENGQIVAQRFDMAPQSRATILVDALAGLENTALSAVVTSTAVLPLAVERTMRWDATGYGAHTEKATTGAALNWYFAEGSQGFFDTFLLLTNPGTTSNMATVKFLIEGDRAVTKKFALSPTSRTSVWAGAFDDLRGASFGTIVTFTQPGVAERAMYFGAAPYWSGGHESAGVTAPATQWFHAEGATGAFFDTFILVANPNSVAAEVTFTYLLESGAVVTRARTIAADSRATINLETEDPLLRQAAAATLVSSSVPIVSERAMYWPGSPGSWYDGHNSFGVTGSGTKWALGEGRVGGPDASETYILLANPGATAVDVTMTYLREGGAPPIVRTHTVPPTSRLTVYANATPLANERFGALIEATAPIVVERAMYSSAGGLFWAAGTNATATRVP